MKPQLQPTHTQLEKPAKPIELGLVLDRSDSMNSLGAYPRRGVQHALQGEERRILA